MDKKLIDKSLMDMVAFIEKIKYQMVYIFVGIHTMDGVISLMIVIQNIRKNIIRYIIKCVNYQNVL